MRLLTGLIHPDSGTIEMLGKPFGRRDRHRLFEVGALIEAPSFYPYLSGRENLRSLAAVGAPTPAARIEVLLELVGLKERAKDKVQTYSLGMKQRLGIAAAMLSDPKLLLLDEPANGLDPAGIVAMRETLKRPRRRGQDGLRLEPHPRRGPAARRRPRDHRRGQARARGPDRGPAPGRGHHPSAGRRVRGGRGVADPRPASPATGPRPTPERDGGWIAIRLEPEPGGRDQPGARLGRDLRLRPRDGERPRVALPRADTVRATDEPRGDDGRAGRLGPGRGWRSRRERRRPRRWRRGAA